jgi:hypothetical protein
LINWDEKIVIKLNYKWSKNDVKMMPNLMFKNYAIKWSKKWLINDVKNRLKFAQKLTFMAGSKIIKIDQIRPGGPGGSLL